MPLWLALCDLWVAEDRGNTGLTVPFLIGAAKYLSPEECIEGPTQKNLAKLLFEIQQQCPKDRSVRIEMCGTSRKPVVKVADLAVVHGVAELVRARKWNSPASVDTVLT